jgi:acyl-CoA synthetase (AMP-forming)/AMP-acid ligase II
MSNLISCLEEWQAMQPDTVLYTFRDGKGNVLQSYTYREFSEASAILADALADTGIGHGDRALILHPPGLELMKALFACMRIGVIATVAPVTSLSGLRSQRLQHRIVGIYEDCNPKICLGVSNQIIDSLAELNINAPFFSTDNVEPRSPTWRTQFHEIALLQYTSGSTSKPKGVVITHKNITANARALIDHPPISATWLPQFHDMGLIGHYLFPLVMGGSSHGISAMDFIRRPELWLRTISEHRATFTAAPTFGFEHLLRVDVPEEKLVGIDLSSLKVLMCGAEPVPANLYSRFLDRFARYGLKSSVLVTAYGLAEATLAVTHGGSRIIQLDADSLTNGFAKEPRSDRTISLCSCGTVLPNLTVNIIDPSSNKSLSEGEVGEICIRGESIADGYWHEIRDNQYRVQLKTRDIGFLLNDELYVCGRTDDLIIRQGQNYHPHDVENLVREKLMPTVNNCVLFEDNNERVTLLFEVRRDELPENLQALSDNIVRLTGLRVDRIIAAPPRSIAHTTSGKLARTETKLRLEKGAITPINDYTLTEREGVLQLF